MQNQMQPHWQCNTPSPLRETSAKNFFDYEDHTEEKELFDCADPEKEKLIISASDIGFIQLTIYPYLYLDSQL